MLQLRELGEARDMYTVLSREVERLRAEAARAEEQRAGMVPRAQVAQWQAQLSGLQQQLSQQGEQLGAAQVWFVLCAVLVLKEWGTWR